MGCARSQSGKVLLTRFLGRSSGDFHQSSYLSTISLVTSDRWTIIWNEGSCGWLGIAVEVQNCELLDRVWHIRNPELLDHCKLESEGLH